MRFSYIGQPIHGDDIIYRPFIPITFSHNKRSVTFKALVDTGADRTILPLETAVLFGFTFDLQRDREEWDGAGGGKFYVYKSPEPVEYSIEQKGFRMLEWKAHVYFTLKAPTILLGHKGCLDRLDLTFRGKQKMLEIVAAK